MNTNEYVSLFFDFVNKVKKTVCKVEGDDIIPMHQANQDWDPLDPANRERLLSMTWNVSASTWAGVEKNSTYTQTMAVLIERLLKLTDISNRKLRILSLGSGPGLYEIFLAYWLRSIGRNARMYSLDYSEGMVAFQNGLLSSDLRIDGVRVSALKEAVTPVLGNMEDLRKFYGGMDIVFCNNALQWVADWRAAVREMQLALNENGPRTLVVVIHPNAMVVHVGDKLIERELITEEALFDELEKHRIQPVFQRYMIGNEGTGQAGGRLNRMFFEARFYPLGVSRSWREMSRPVGKATFVKL